MSKNNGEFDVNIVNLISAFLLLKEKCDFYYESAKEKAFSKEEYCEFGVEGISTFYLSFKGLCDLPIFFLINEEISNASNRKFYDEILNEALESENFKRNFDSDVGFQLTKKKHGAEIRDLLKYRFNEIVGSLMLDFTVDSFSVFECWIDHIFNQINSKDMGRSAHEQVRQLNGKNRELALKGKASRGAGNFPFPKKLEAVFKFLDLGVYKRNFDYDKKIVDFLRKRRNAIHNLGIYVGEDVYLTFNEVEFSLRKNEPLKSESFVDYVGLVGELIGIYTEIINSVKFDDGVCVSFIQPKLRMSELISLSVKFVRECADNEESVSNFKHILNRHFSIDKRGSDLFVKDLVGNRSELASSDEIGSMIIDKFKLYCDYPVYI